MGWTHYESSLVFGVARSADCVTPSVETGVVCILMKRYRHKLAMVFVDGAMEIKTSFVCMA